MAYLPNMKRSRYIDELCSKMDNLSTQSPPTAPGDRTREVAPELSGPRAGPSQPRGEEAMEQLDLQDVPRDVTTAGQSKDKWKRRSLRNVGAKTQTSAPAPKNGARHFSYNVTQDDLKLQLNLLKATRKAKHVAGAWSRDGKIFARHNDGSVHRVFNKSDIWALETASGKGGKSQKRRASDAYLAERDEEQGGSGASRDDLRSGDVLESGSAPDGHGAASSQPDPFGWSIWGRSPLFLIPSPGDHYDVLQAHSGSAYQAARRRWMSCQVAPPCWQQRGDGEAEEDADSTLLGVHQTLEETRLEIPNGSNGWARELSQAPWEELDTLGPNDPGSCPEASPLYNPRPAF